MVTFHLRLKKTSKPKHTRLKFDLEMRKDPNVLETVQAVIGRRFAPLTIMSNEGTSSPRMKAIDSSQASTSRKEKYTSHNKWGKMYLLPIVRQLTAEEITHAETHSLKSLNKTFP